MAINGGLYKFKNSATNFLTHPRQPLQSAYFIRESTFALRRANMNDQENPDTGPSRREFLGAAATATALTGLATVDAAAAELQPGGGPAVAGIGPAATK